MPSRRDMCTLCVSNVFLSQILTQHASWGNGELQWINRQQITARTSVASFWSVWWRQFYLHDVSRWNVVFSHQNLRSTCKCLYYSETSWLDFFTCNGGKLATSEGYTCLFVVFYVSISKESPANKWFVIQLVVGQSAVNMWIYYSRFAPMIIHFTTDLQPVLYWATNHYKQEYIS